MRSIAPASGSSGAAAAAGRPVRVVRADGFARRMLGLMFRRDMPEGEALLIPRCPAVHTFFMRFALDLVFLDAAGRPVKTVRGVKPWRPFVWGGPKARAVLESKASPDPKKNA